MTDRLPNLWCNRCMSLVREVEQNPDGTHTICGKMLAIVDDDEPDAAELESEVDRLRALLPKAFDAGVAHAIRSHADFQQTHPGRDEWVRQALGGDHD